MKRFIFVLVAFVGVVAFVACGADAALPAEADAAVSIEQVQGDVSAHFGAIALTGTVANVTSRDFQLTTEAADFHVTVDFRGSQAMPQNGDRITVTGNLREDCCNPGYILLATVYEAVN